MIRVNARLFAAAAICISTDETRYYLTGVRIEPHPEKGALLVATDGHRLIVIHDVEGECSKAAIVSLPKEMAAACVEWIVSESYDEWDNPASSKSLGDDRILRVDDDGRAEIERHFRALTDCRVDGDYPDWRKVLPVPAEGPRGAPMLKGQYLDDFGKISKLLTQGNTGVRIVGGNTHNDPALIRFSDQFAFGVLMPLKSEAAELSLPPFMNEKPKAAA